MDWIFGLIIFMALYLIPTWIAWARHHNVGGVAIVNVLLGWSVIGWVIALVMACGNTRQQVVVHQYAGAAPAADAPPAIEPTRPAE